MSMMNLPHNNVFQHLSEEEVQAKMQELMAKGMSEDDAFSEVYAIDCNMDEECPPCAEPTDKTGFGISLSELWNFVTDGEQVNRRDFKTAHGRILKTVEYEDSYFDLYNASGVHACADGEAVEVISEDAESVTLHSLEEEEGLNFTLSRKEYEACVYPDN